MLSKNVLIHGWAITAEDHMGFYSISHEPEPEATVERTAVDWKNIAWSFSSHQIFSFGEHVPAVVVSPPQVST